MCTEIFILAIKDQAVVKLLIQKVMYSGAVLYPKPLQRVPCGMDSPGKYKDQIMKLKLVHSICSNSIINESVGSFLKSGKYEKHLWQLRKTLQENYLNYAQTIAQHFPEGTKISQPKGGLALWVEFSGDINTVELLNWQ